MVTTTLTVPEIRDYQRINRLVAQALEDGATEVRLAGVDGQRLLLYGLRGTWNASLIVEGDAGPELAAEVDAPGLRILCRGHAADGAGRDFRAGSLVIQGHCGVALGYCQRGGVVVACHEVGPRAGLEQAGGVLVVHGPVGPFAGERQRAGSLVFAGASVDLRIGPGRRGGAIVDVSGQISGVTPAGDVERVRLQGFLQPLKPWVPFDLSRA